MASEDTTTSVEDVVEIPIDLNSIDKSLLLFYLAGKTPLSVADFAENCTNKPSTVGYILRTRFENETSIDMDHTLRLSSDTRHTVIRGGEALISAGDELLVRGKSHLSRDDHAKAADCFAQAVSSLQSVAERYDAIDYESAKLEDIITTTKGRHDSAAVEAAKKSINHHVVRASQLGNEAEKHIDHQPSRAAEYYQKAANQLSQALETTKEHNQSTWKEDSKLAVQPIKRKLTDVSEKLDSVEDSISTSATEASNDSGDAEMENKPSSEPSDQDLIDAVQRLAAKCEESPRPEVVDKYGEYPADGYIETFGSWEDALTAANLDLIDEATRERRVYSRMEVLDAVGDLIDKLGHVPSQTEMNRKGAVSATTVANRCENWNTALSLVNRANGVKQPSKQQVSRGESDENKVARTAEPPQHNSTEADEDGILDEIASDFDDL
jgi:hypothetical protein